MAWNASIGTLSLLALSSRKGKQKTSGRRGKKGRKQTKLLSKTLSRKRFGVLNIKRHSLGMNTTPVTAESFAKWKKDRTEKKDQIENDERKAKLEAMSRGFRHGGVVFSGRDMVILTLNLV